MALAILFFGTLLISVDTFVLLSGSLNDVFVTEPEISRGVVDGLSGGQNRGVSVVLPPGTYFRDRMYLYSTAELPWNQESGNLVC